MLGLKKILSWMHLRRKNAEMTTKTVIDAIVLLAMDQNIWVLAGLNVFKSAMKTTVGLVDSAMPAVYALIEAFNGKQDGHKESKISAAAKASTKASTIIATNTGLLDNKNEPKLLGDVIKDDTTEEQKDRLKEVVTTATSLKASSGRELFRKLKKDPLEQKVVLNAVFKFIKAEKNMGVVNIK